MLAGFYALPLAAQMALAAVATLLVLTLLRVASTKFTGRAPPCEEGIPFIGGLIKFSKASRAPAAAARRRRSVAACDVAPPVVPAHPSASPARPLPRMPYSLLEGSLWLCILYFASVGCMAAAAVAQSTAPSFTGLAPLIHPPACPRARCP